ncbi:GNVR domain-containing protein [Hoeflea sp.]|uniref:GNVR domain-containing protein n=1 Tax=Hoeflea sp. TaxID=1940281 RepID=UPI003B525429
MSDNANDRRQRARRGSLLDHAAGAPPPRRGTSGAEGQPSQAARGAPASLLSAPTRSPRISTARVARDISPSDNLPEPANAQAAQSPGRTGTSRPSFGDRIASLLHKADPEATDQPAGSRQPDADHASQASHTDGPAETRRQEPLDTGPAHPRSEPAGAGEPPRQPPQQPVHWADADERPLLDMSILIQAVWRWRMLIGFATVAGAIVGVLIALATPHKYYGESRLFVDPREVRVTEDDVRNQQLSTEAILAIIDSQLQILSSPSVLEAVIDELGLAQDPEFNGAMSSGGIGAGINLVKELLTGRDPMSDAKQHALEYLRDALSVSRDAMTFVIIVGVETRDPEKSALIANTIVTTYLDEEGEAQSDLLERTSDAIDTRINALREDLDAAERAVERFKAENGIVGVGGQSIDDQEILAISEQLANARAVKVGVRVKAESLAKANPEEVLAGSFPEEFLSANLIDLRKQYTQTKSNADALATRLGPRHPQYVSARQSLETIREEITRELRRIVASSQSELQRAVETEQELASQMAVAKSRAMDQSVEFVTLRELERKATATKEIYEAFLRRSRETSERSNLSTRNVRVISPAEAPLQPMGPSRKLIAIGGMMAGFFMGFGLALLAGAVESIRAFTAAGNGSSWTGRDPLPPFGGSPAPQPPSPGTPPRDPGPGSRQGAGSSVFGAIGAGLSRERKGNSAGHATASASDEDFAHAPDPVTDNASPAAAPQNPGRTGPVVDPAQPVHTVSSGHPETTSHRGSVHQAHPHAPRQETDHLSGFPGYQAPYSPSPMYQPPHQPQPHVHRPAYHADQYQAAQSQGYAPQGYPPQPAAQFPAAAPMPAAPMAAPIAAPHAPQPAPYPRHDYSPQPYYPGHPAAFHPASQHHPAGQHQPVQQHPVPGPQAWGAQPQPQAINPHYPGYVQQPHYPQQAPFQSQPFHNGAMPQPAAPHPVATPAHPDQAYPGQGRPEAVQPAQLNPQAAAHPEPRQAEPAPRDEAVDRIREKMEELRTRIGDRSGLRRRA